MCCAIARPAVGALDVLNLVGQHNRATESVAGRGRLSDTTIIQPVSSCDESGFSPDSSLGVGSGEWRVGSGEWGVIIQRVGQQERIIMKCFRSLRACEKMGTASGQLVQNPDNSDCQPVPVPIFSQTLRPGSQPIHFHPAPKQGLHTRSVSTPGARHRLSPHYANSPSNHDLWLARESLLAFQ